MDIQGCILDNSLIIASLPTIQYCLKNKAKSIVLISHLDEPGGKPQQNLSLGPIANELNRLLGKTIQFLPNCVGYDVERICNMAKDGDIILLENLKFHPEEDLIIRRRMNPKVVINYSLILLYSICSLYLYFYYLFYFILFNLYFIFIFLLFILFYFIQFVLYIYISTIYFILFYFIYVIIY